MAQKCPTCNECCVTVCQEFVSPRCPCCDATAALRVAPNQSIKAGQAVAENIESELVAYNPNAQSGNLTESAKFAGFASTWYSTDDEGKITNRGTNIPLTGNPCPKNRALFWVCGVFRISLIVPYAGLKSLDIARAVVATGRGHFLPLGENDNGEVKIY